MDTSRSAVRRIAAILRAVAVHEPAGATTSAVARTAVLPRPTVHRLLTGLLEAGLVDREPDGRWQLGPELYLLGAGAARRFDVTAVARPVVRRLAELTGESAFFSARRGDETVCIIQEEGSFPIRSHVLHEGIRFPLGVASAGLAILAFLPAAEIADHLGSIDLAAAYGPEHSSERVHARLEKARRDGYAVNPGLIVEGSWGMAAAVFDGDDQPRWALSLTGIEQRLAGDRGRELGERLMRAAHELGRRLSS